MLVYAQAVMLTMSKLQEVFNFEITGRNGCDRVDKLTKIVDW